MDNLEDYIDNDNTSLEIGGNSSPRNAMFYEDMDRELLAVESMINLHETMRLSNKPSPEHINLFNLAVEQAYAVIDLHAPKSLSLESLTLTPRLAKESLLEDAKDADIKGLIEMCDISLAVSDSIRKLYGDINRMSDLGAVYVTVDYFAHAFFPIT